MRMHHRPRIIPNENTIDMAYQCKQALLETDKAPILATLLRSFADDPVLKYFTRDDGDRCLALIELCSIIWEECRPDGYIYGTDALRSIALWKPPNSGPVFSLGNALARLSSLIRIVSMDKLFRALRALHAIQRATPSKPHFYCALLGTDPGFRRQGLASRLLSAVTAIADANGVGCYLENSRPENTAFFEKHGFKSLKTIRLGGGEGAPSLVGMWRDPRRVRLRAPTPPPLTSGSGVAGMAVHSNERDSAETSAAEAEEPGEPV